MTPHASLFNGITDLRLNLLLSASVSTSSSKQSHHELDQRMDPVGKKKIITEKNWYMAHDITTQVAMPAQQQL